MISFNLSRNESELIAKCVDRALALAAAQRLNIRRLDLSMDLAAAHANGNPLRLAELLAADDFSFTHDVFGIHRHINREDGSLENCFVPRFRHLGAAAE